MSTLDPSLKPSIKSAAAADDHTHSTSDHAVEEKEEADPEPGHHSGDNNNEGSINNDDSHSQQDDFLEPSRWWFASTATPLLAASFGPIASGFSICALSSAWREFVPVGATESKGSIAIKDPVWETAINAVSLACALIGNASLLLNMAHRLPFSIAQPTTICGFFLAGALLVADMAALTAAPHYGINLTDARPHNRHALTGAFYYAGFAAGIYIIISLLLCGTVVGALKGYYERELQLTQPQRTLMLQTMLLVAYLLLGALVYCHVEDWQFLDAFYWADVSVLTVGLGDYSPKTQLGRGLFIPFELGGVLILGLVVGSIRSLVLDRGDEKLGARIVEKRRTSAAKDVDNRRQTVKISMFARADFSIDPTLSNAQRREEEFNVMRKVQNTADRERRWFGLASSSSFALVLWFVGAAIFMQCEFEQDWTYFQSFYFSYVVLLTVGYGDFVPRSNSGKAFFVIWSLLAVPSLTILISNLGDTVVQWFKDGTAWFGSVTLLPDEDGFRKALGQPFALARAWWQDFSRDLHGPKFLGFAPVKHEKRPSAFEYEARMRQVMVDRLGKHLSPAETPTQNGTALSGSEREQDALFYAYVLARECRNLRFDMANSPAKKYDWAEWEYYLRLMGGESDLPNVTGGLVAPSQSQNVPQRNCAEGKTQAAGGMGSDSEKEEPFSSHDTSPEAIPAIDGNVDRRTSVAQQLAAQRRRRARHMHPELEPEPDFLADWSWLSNGSPLMSKKTESEWILDRLSAALERTLDCQRRGIFVSPPIGIAHAVKGN